MRERVHGPMPDTKEPMVCGKNIRKCRSIVNTNRGDSRPTAGHLPYPPFVLDARGIVVAKPLTVFNGGYYNEDGGHRSAFRQSW